jgi:hypothetical protein
MNQISNNVEILPSDEGKIRIKTTTEEEYDCEEAMKMLNRLSANIGQTETQIKQIRDSIEKKQLEKNIEVLEVNLKNENEYKVKVEEALKPYMERLFESGRTKVEFKKKEEAYDRLPSDAAEKKMSLKNKILNEVRDELGLADISHPVMIRLRHEQFKEENQ